MSRRKLRIALQLYAAPGAWPGLWRKSCQALRTGGLIGLWRSVRTKLAQPGLPVGEAEKAVLRSLAYEDRWTGHGESARHRVSAVILSREQALLDASLASIGKSVLRSARLEILVVSNGGSLRIPPVYPFPLRLLREKCPFNWSAYNNLAARQSGGEFLLFLNDDVEALHGGWLDAMLEAGLQPGVGAVGAKLLYPGGLVQHWGIKVGGDEGEASHLHKFQRRDWPGENGELLRVRRVDAVTGACLLTPRGLFLEMGGFDERFALSYNDVDYCLRLRQAGLAVVVTPHAELVHKETATRSWKVRPREKRLFREKWGHLL